MVKSVLILGASGRTGRHAIAMALAENFPVVVLVRDAGKIKAREGLTVIRGTPTLSTICGK